MIDNLDNPLNKGFDPFIANTPTGFNDDVSLHSFERIKNNCTSHLPNQIQHIIRVYSFFNPNWVSWFIFSWFMWLTSLWFFSVLTSLVNYSLAYSYWLGDRLPSESISTSVLSLVLTMLSQFGPQASCTCRHHRIWHRGRGERCDHRAAAFCTAPSVMWWVLSTRRNTMCRVSPIYWTPFKSL